MRKNPKAGRRLLAKNIGVNDNQSKRYHPAALEALQSAPAGTPALAAA